MTDKSKRFHKADYKKGKFENPKNMHHNTPYQPLKEFFYTKLSSV